MFIGSRLLFYPLFLEILSKNFPKAKTPKGSLPIFMMYFAVPFHPALSFNLVGQLTEICEYDSSKAKGLFGIPNISYEKSVVDTASSILELGLLKENPGKNSLFG